MNIISFFEEYSLRAFSDDSTFALINSICFDRKSLASLLAATLLSRSYSINDVAIVFATASDRSGLFDSKLTLTS